MKLLSSYGDFLLTYMYITDGFLVKPVFKTNNLLVCLYYKVYTKNSHTTFTHVRMTMLVYMYMYNVCVKYCT